jgi:hypothetical protein
MGFKTFLLLIVYIDSLNERIFSLIYYIEVYILFYIFYVKIKDSFTELRFFS